MGQPAIKDFLCSFCNEIKRIRARKDQKFCSVECSKKSRVMFGPEVKATSDEFDIDDIPESPEIIVQQYCKKNNQLLVKNKNLQTEVKLLKNSINFSENITHVLKSGIRALPIIKSITTYKKTSSQTHEEEAVLMLSDLHAAEIVSALETDNFGEYNFEIFCLRMQELFDSIIRITDIQRKGGAKLDVLNVFSLGDLISGEIHLELLRTNEFPLITSAFQVSTVLAQFLAKLSVHFKEIKFYGVNGNHDRLTQEKVMKGRYDDTARIIYETLPLLTAKYSNIKYTIPKSPFTVVNVYDWKYLLTHGDLKISGAVYTGMEKLNKEFQMIYMKRGGFDLLCTGHYHNPASLDGVLMNGALVGAGEYSMLNVRKITTPSQKFFGVTKKRKTTWVYDTDITPDTHEFIYNEDFLASDLMEQWENS
jgi:predicted phosphodiesterase